MKSLFKLGMVHTMSHEKFKKYAYDGSMTYLPSKISKCYKEEKFQKVVSSKGEEVMSRATYYTEIPVNALDRIDGYDIINVEHLNMGCNYYIIYV